MLILLMTKKYINTLALHDNCHDPGLHIMQLQRL